MEFIPIGRLSRVISCHFQGKTHLLWSVFFLIGFLFLSPAVRFALIDFSERLRVVLHFELGSVISIWSGHTCASSDQVSALKIERSHSSARGGRG